MPTMKENYASYAAKREEVAASRMGQMMLNQEKNYAHPFRIYGNVWYVGDKGVCVHLIDTGDGLLLIDAGNLDTTGMLVNAIWEAGFKPSDVKWIVLSHGHLDHFGAAVFFRRMFGTKIYLGAPDAKMFREQPELSYIQDTLNIANELPMPDVEIHDGEKITFGNTEMQFYLCPGHTEGVVAIFFDAHAGNDTKRVGYYGGFGFNTLQKAYLLEIGDTEYQMRKIYLESLAKVRDQKVEIFLGNHPINNDTFGRYQKMLDDPAGPNPFVDPEAFGKYLDQKRDDLLAFMADPKNN